MAPPFTALAMQDESSNGVFPSAIVSSIKTAVRIKRYHKLVQPSGLLQREDNLSKGFLITYSVERTETPRSAGVL
jgi:hypothetical protein